jgi:hypothetical protein
MLLEAGDAGERQSALRVGKHAKILAMLCLEPALGQAERLKERLKERRFVAFGIVHPVGTALSAEARRPSRSAGLGWEILAVAVNCGENSIARRW